MGFFARVKQFFTGLFKRKQPTLGLALGSGGAKGMAHLGAIKAFEEEGIKFSFIAGTSIGAIVGALYAKGYSSADMAGIVAGVNAREFTKNLRPFADMEFAERMLGGYLEENIEDLPVPFACWATDANTNEGHLFDHGKAARAVIASSAMPPFFRSVEADGKRFYDGAFTNAIPADVCKDMGADVVVGIDLSAYARAGEEKGTVARLLGAALTRVSPVRTAANAKSRGYGHADIMLRPELLGYRPTDFSRADLDAMFELGYREAKAKMPDIREALRTFKRGKGGKR